MHFARSFRSAAACAALLALGSQALAARVYLDPDDIKTLPGAVSVGLFMDFAAGEATLGGGVDLDVTGPASFVSFVPSAWFTGTADPAFTGHGTTRADADYEIHFGHFNGLSGNNLIGTITVNYAGPETAVLRLASNQFWGGFFGVNGQPQTVQFGTATITLVPEPATAAMWLLGALAVASRMRRMPLPRG